MRLNRDIRTLIKQGNQFPAVVLDVHGDGRATVKLSYGGQRLRNLPVVGGLVNVGDTVIVDFGSYQPIVKTPASAQISPELLSQITAWLRRRESQPMLKGIEGVSTLSALSGLVVGGITADLTGDVDTYARQIWKEYYSGYVAQTPHIASYEMMRGIQRNEYRYAIDYDNASFGYTTWSSWTFHIHPYIYRFTHPSTPDYRISRYDYIADSTDFVSIPRQITDWWIINSNFVLLQTVADTESVYFEVANLSTGISVPIETWSYPSPYYYRIGPKVITRDASNNPFLLWYAIVADGSGQPETFDAYALDITGESISTGTIYTIPTPTTTYFSGVSSDTDLRGLPVVIGNKVFWFPFLLNGATNNLGIILSIDTSLNMDYHIHYTSTHLPVITNTCVANGNIYFTRSLDGYPPTTHTRTWNYIDTSLTTIVPTKTLNDPISGDDKYVALKLASNTSMAVWINLLGKIYDMDTHTLLGNIGNYYTNPSRTPYGFTPGDVQDIQQELSAGNDLYYYVDNGGVVEIHAVDLDTGTTRLVQDGSEHTFGYQTIYYNT